MSASIVAASIANRELVLTRLIHASADKVFRAWTEPELLKQWFCPRPWTTPVFETDVRVGGSTFCIMRGPQGQELPNHGVYLEVVPNRKLVFTDAYTKAWEPSAKPFFTCVLTFGEEAGKTRYTARALHWSQADREQHEQMGFREGWAKATDQLEAVVAGL